MRIQYTLATLVVLHQIGVCDAAAATLSSHVFSLDCQGHVSVFKVTVYRVGQCC